MPLFAIKARPAHLGTNMLRPEPPGWWIHIKMLLEGISPGPVVKKPSCNAGDVGSIPGWRTKIPHATEQLSLQATARESMCPNKDPTCGN